MNSSSMMLLPFTWISKCEQSCLVEDILLCLPSIGYKSPFNWHIVIQHFALQGVLNSSPSFEMRGLCVIVLCSCCNMFHWGSCRKETNDLARARSSLSIIRQTMFVCLRNSVFPSGKSCCVRRLLAKDKIAGVSSITDPSVHIGRGLLRKILPCETFHLTSPAPKEKGLGSRLLSMSRRWHTSRWKIDCTTRQQVRLRHGARAKWLAIEIAMVSSLRVRCCKHLHKDAGRHTMFVCLWSNSCVCGKTAATWGICRLRVSWRTSPNLKTREPARNCVLGPVLCLSTQW